MSTKVPYRAALEAVNCFYPYNPGPDDITEEIVDDEGKKTVVLKDWTIPPKALRCPCQEAGEDCTCGRGALPDGVAIPLWWDKTTQKHRYLFMYYEPYNTLLKPIFYHRLFHKLHVILSNFPLRIHA